MLTPHVVEVRRAGGLTPAPRAAEPAPPSVRVTRPALLVASPR